MVFYIEKIEIDLTENKYGLQLNTAHGTTPLPGQTLDSAMDTIQKNFETVKEHFTCVEVGVENVKGKREKVKIFGILDKDIL